MGASSLKYNVTRLVKSFEICEAVRQVGENIDSEVFRKMPTGYQTILMLTKMPESVGVREVDQLSSIYLAHLQNLIFYEATVCKKSPAGV
uniref:Uncharacterized protein n=1 Tax=Plectus sambesii TaxID=2011161 RepID=A0A914VW80_9BILA